MTARLIVGALVGAIAGYGIYRVIGCSTGTCPITSNPWISTLYGMLMGAVASGIGRV